MSLTPVTIGTFTPSLLIALARQWGIFDQYGLQVTEVPVHSSPSQFEMLESGEIDFGFTSPDNVIAYRFIPNNPLERILPIRIVRAIDRGLGLSLCVQSDGNAPERLGVKNFGVDVPQSGFAFAGYALLEKVGLSQSDYAVQALGGTPSRVRALSDGICDATMLDAGFELQAQATGGRIHVPVVELGPYLATVLVAIEDPATNASGSQCTVSTALLETIDETIQRIFDDKYRSDVLDAAMSVRGLSAGQAREHYDTIRDPRQGFVRSGLVDPESMELILGLREKYLPHPELETARKDYAQIMPDPAFFHGARSKSTRLDME